ncbi:MAG: tetratricopeptide repeat protein [Treponema sp.]|nr:tetratricopeptide repeat protein [Treponema sp.]
MSENSLILSRADSAVMSRDYALAARLYSTLLKDSPSDLELLKRLGNVYIKSGEDKKAQDIYETLLTLEPKNPDFLLTLGGIYRRIKMYDKSIEVLNKALKAGAKEVQVYYNLGFTYKFQENFKDAIDCFETVVTLNPNDVLAYNHMGSIYEKKKEYDAAIQAYQMGLKVDPNHPILHFNLAQTYEASGNIDGSIREYEAALRYKPGWKEAYVEYARLLFKKGRIKEAENVTEQAIKVNGDSARLQSLMGDIYMAEDFYEGAEERYHLSLKSDPKRVKALLGLAKAYEAQGKNADAVEAIQKAKSIAADDDRVIKDSVSINLSAKKLAAANKDIKALFEKDQDDLETLDLAGQYYICSDEETRADDCYKKIESFDPSYKMHLKNASKRYRQKGKLDKAQDVLKEYIRQTAPSNATTYVALGKIEEEMGNPNEALAAYNRALELGSENKMAKTASSRIAASIGKENIQTDVDLGLDDDLNAGFDETDSVQIDMGQEENLEEENAEEEDTLTTDDFDFDAFGKSPLLDDEPEIDFGDIADTTDEEEAEDEKANDMDLLGDESTLKDKPEEEEEKPFDFDSALPEDMASGEASAPTEKEEPAYNSEPAYEPPYEPQPQPQRYEPPRDYPPQNYAPDPRADERLRELENANRDLMNKMAQIEDNAKKASDSAEKAWYAAQKAADNAQAIEQSQDELNEKMALMAEEAAKKAAEALEEYKAEKEAEKEAEDVPKDPQESEEPQESAEDDGLDDLFDDILGTTVPGEEEAEEDAGEDAADKFSDDDESFVDAPASEPVVEEEPEPEPKPEPVPEEDVTEQFAGEGSEPEPEAEPEPEPPTFDSAVQKATQMIPAIENILKKDGSDRDYSAEIKLFKTLRSLSESLPESERKEFLQSRTRVTLDYLISKLEGRPGLLKTSHALRKSGALSDYVKEEDVSADYSQDELARIVVTDMKALAGFLEEDDLVVALNKLADNFLDSQE